VRLFHRKTKVEKMLQTLESNDAVKAAARRAVESAVTGRGSSKHGHPLTHVLEAFESGKTRKPAARISRAAKSGLALTAGVAAVTAVSAGVSNLRQRAQAAPEGAPEQSAA
jgi:hypothetical protein